MGAYRTTYKILRIKESCRMDYQLSYDLATGEIVDEEFKSFIKNNVEVVNLSDNEEEDN